MIADSASVYRTFLPAFDTEMEKMGFRFSDCGEYALFAIR